MAKFIRIGKEVINLDSIAYAMLNADGRGSVALQLCASTSIADSDRHSMNALQVNALSATVRIYRGESAKKITAMLLDEATSLDDQDKQPAA